MSEFQRATASPLFLRDAELRRSIELLYFAYRDFVGEADRLLDAQGLGRAHHRALYFIARQEGLHVGALLEILQISKQSLARVLRQLLDQELVRQEAKSSDRRRRQLYLTDSGRDLERQLVAAQKHLLGRAYKGLAPEAIKGFHQVLINMIQDKTQAYRYDAAQKRDAVQEHDAAQE